MRSIKEVLMSRDGMSEREAQEMIDDFQSTINEALDESISLSELEEAFMLEFRLEPDYLDELIFEI